ncbi:thiamine pyrophosphate-requiring protein [Amycolatopsis pigmentata]|uniref:Thiamine pyrophosphate-requiring protein n=1 Tax=Amycolatopsis pigmentata TaxID=450801 RepID=A0ABW5FZV9_9PSEU
MPSLPEAVTTADAFVGALGDAGIEMVFGNLGSDHPGIIEALAKARERGDRTPAVVLAPHEAVALAAAHGYALASGDAAAVLVHVDVGTANLGGGVHNAARGRVPVLLVAGLTPFTMEGELPGSRNSYPNHLQDVHDQHAIVRPYAKWSYDLRTGANVRQVTHRALQLARSAPRGPVYLTAAREVLAAPTDGRRVDPALWQPVEPIPAPEKTVREIVDAIARARFPVIVTSSFGRDPSSVELLVELAETLGVGVAQPIADAMGFPADHELHLGYSAGPVLEQADVVVVLDSDVPWMPTIAAPKPDAAVFLIDADPLKEEIPLWYLESRRFVRADSTVAIGQLLASARAGTQLGDVAGRRGALAATHRAQRQGWAAEREGSRLTVPVVAAAVAEAIDEGTIVLNESVSNAETVFRHLPRNRPGTLFASGGSSLGWFAGAAVGVKLARPDATVVALAGDGTYFLSSPAAAYWMAHRYDAPFLTVVLDNGGWHATKRNVLRQYPDGAAAKTGRYWVDLSQTADLAGVAAAAGGAFAATVTEIDELAPSLAEGLDAVKTGRAAVVRVVLDRIAAEPADSLPDGSYCAGRYQSDHSHGGNGAR